MANNPGFNILRFLNRKKLLIIYYHRVVRKKELAEIKEKNMCVDIDDFDRQMKFLGNKYKPVSEKEIIDFIERGMLPEYSVWVTFDDGYKDNYTNAYPILRKYKIPATFFVTTGFINKLAIPCEDYISKAINMTRLKEIKLALNGNEYKISLCGENDKRVARKRLWEIGGDRGIMTEKYFEPLVTGFDVKIEEIADLFMAWEEIEEMVENGFSIRGHTCNHKILSSLTKDEIAKEISGSKHEIEKRLGITLSSFAYPGGKRNEYNSSCFQILEKCGFRQGISTIGGIK